MILLAFILLLVLAVLNLLVGSVDIPADEVWHALTGGSVEKESWRYIIIESRLPQTITAMLCGASLSTSGLLLQTSFRNPLAGPSILGITNGASVGVAIVMLLTGGVLSLGADSAAEGILSLGADSASEGILSLGADTARQPIIHYSLFTIHYSLCSFAGSLAVITAAFIGSLLVILLLLALSSVVRSNLMLLIVGIMISYLTSSIVSLLNFCATADNIQSYVTWGMGSFSGVTLGQLPWFSLICVIGLAIALLLIKPLNALLLGDEYAISLGVNVKSTRRMLLIATGILTAAATAFCGPVAFIGLAVPHIARLLTRTANHLVLMPCTILLGAVIALLCNLICIIPENTIIPLNAVTPLFGAPVILYIILRKK